MFNAVMKVFMFSEREGERERRQTLLLYVASVLLGFYLKKKKKIWEERLFFLFKVDMGLAWLGMACV
jgi:hypothetical protein